MDYTVDEVLQYAREEDVKFVRLAFCDVFGTQKNVSIMADELTRAFERGFVIDGSAIAGFSRATRGDLVLHPDPSTLAPLPWRPEHGRVVQMFSSITRPDGTPFSCDTRSLLVRASERAEQAGLSLLFGAKQEFYLFELDDQGRPTSKPADHAGYMDIAPEDACENVRREVCLTLEQMGIHPESSHHEAGPGQNEVVFCRAEALAAADNAMTFQRVVRTIAHRNGFHADFSAKPLPDAPGNGFHICMATDSDCGTPLEAMLAGIMARIREITLFLNPTEGSYKRLGRNGVPNVVTWSSEDRSRLVRVTSAEGVCGIELRSPDPMTNPYLVLSLLIHAAVDGVERGLVPPAPFDSPTAGTSDRLPGGLDAARLEAAGSPFVSKYVPADIVASYCGA